MVHVKGIDTVAAIQVLETGVVDNAGDRPCVLGAAGKLIGIGRAFQGIGVVTCKLFDIGESALYNKTDK